MVLNVEGTYTPEAGLKSSGAYGVIHIEGVTPNETLELSIKAKHWPPLHAGMSSSAKVDICIVRSPDDDSVEDGEYVSVGVAIGLWAKLSSY